MRSGPPSSPMQHVLSIVLGFVRMVRSDNSEVTFMAGRMALVGGDDFRSGCEETDSEILKATAKSRPRVLIIPTAAAT